MDNLKKLAAAGFLVGFLGVGGATLAGAQDETDSSTTTTVVEDGTETPAPSDAPAATDENCPNMGEDGGTGDGTSSTDGSDTSESSAGAGQL